MTLELPGDGGKMIRSSKPVSLGSVLSECETSLGYRRLSQGEGFEIKGVSFGKILGDIQEHIRGKGHVRV